MQLQGKQLLVREMGFWKNRVWGSKEITKRKKTGYKFFTLCPRLLDSQGLTCLQLLQLQCSESIVMLLQDFGVIASIMT